jgi:hypothetical protein
MEILKKEKNKILSVSFSKVKVYGRIALAVK